MNLSEIFKIKGGENFGSIRVFRALSLDMRLSEAIIDIFQIISTFLFSFFIALFEKVDFVIISVPPGVPGVGAFFAAKLLRKKVVFDVRDKWEDYSILSSKYRIVRFTNKRLKRLFDFFYREASLVIGVTPSLIKYLSKRGAPKTALIPNGVDVNLFHPRQLNEKLQLRSKLGLGKEEMVLVYTGGIGGYYRPDIVIQALYNLLNKGHFSKIKFLLIGGGEKSEIKKMLELRKSFGLQGKVIFLGRKSRRIVANILPICDLGVVPYDNNPLWTYPQPTKFFEYCASELPTIATAIENSDLSKLIKDHKIGYVVKPLNATEFENALRDFCKKNEIERKEMGARARSMVEAHFNRQKLAELLLKSLTRLGND